MPSSWNCNRRKGASDVTNMFDDRYGVDIEHNVLRCVLTGKLWAGRFGENADKLIRTCIYPHELEVGCLGGGAEKAGIRQQKGRVRFWEESQDNSAFFRRSRINYRLHGLSWLDFLKPNRNPHTTCKLYYCLTDGTAIIANVVRSITHFFTHSTNQWVDNIPILSPPILPLDG